MEPNHDRREFLQIATAGAAALVAAPAWAPRAIRKAKPAIGAAEKASAPVSTGGRKLPFELGLASYTCRKFDLAKTLEMTNRVGLKHIALKDVHLAMNSTPEQIQAVVAQVKEAGLDLYGGGVIYMSNEAAGQPGLRVRQGRRHESHHRRAQSPSCCPWWTRRSRNTTSRSPSTTTARATRSTPCRRPCTRRSRTSTSASACATTSATRSAPAWTRSPRSSSSPTGSIDVHIKDVTAADPKGGAIEVGRGVIDIPQVLRTLVKINYTGIVSFEYEKDANDPLPGLAESVGYVRGVMATDLRRPSRGS